MSYYLAEDFRNLVNKLNEYLVTTNEETKDPAEDDKDNVELGKDTEKLPAADNEELAAADDEEPADIDDVLTTSKDQITGTVNIAKLTKLIGFDKAQADLFKSAIVSYQTDPQHATPKQNEILAHAFVRTLQWDPEKHRQATTVTTGIHRNDVSEAADEMPENVSISDLESLIKSVAKISPTARLQVTKLANHLIDGIKDKHKDGGIEHVMNFIAQAISAAQNGDQASALDAVLKMVTHVEGDDNAIDSDAFPNIVTDLILIIGELGTKA